MVNTNSLTRNVAEPRCQLIRRMQSSGNDSIESKLSVCVAVFAGRAEGGVEMRIAGGDKLAVLGLQVIRR